MGNSTFAGSSGLGERSHLPETGSSVNLKMLPGATEALDSHISLSKVMLNFGPKHTALKMILPSPLISALPK